MIESVYIRDLVRLQVPYPPMLYEALGYGDTGWDVALFWRAGQLFWADMTETGLGHGPGWDVFIGHPVVAPAVSDWTFGSRSQDSTHFLFARVAERDFHVGLLNQIDAVLASGNSSNERASIDAEVVRLLRQGRPASRADGRARAVADMVRWLDGLVGSGPA